MAIPRVLVKDKPEKKMDIAMLGEGLIGQALAIVFAREFCQVRVWDGDQAALARAHELIARQVGELERQELLSDAAGAVSRIQTCAQLEDALEGVDYVPESLPEIFELRSEERRVGKGFVSTCRSRW